MALASAARECTRELCRCRGDRPRMAGLHAQRGRCLLGMDRAREALRDFDAAVHLAPRSPTYWQLRSLARSRLGDGGRAAFDASVSVELDAERLGQIFATLLPPVSGAGAGGRAAPRRPPPEELFDRARPQLSQASRRYREREEERRLEAVREAEAEAEARAAAEAEAEAERARQAAAAELERLHEQYVELELAKIRAQMEQSAAYAATLAERIRAVDEGLAHDESERALREEEVRVLEGGSAAQRRSRRAALLRGEIEAIHGNSARLAARRQELQHSTRQAVGQAEELRGKSAALMRELRSVQQRGAGG